MKIVYLISIDGIEGRICSKCKIWKPTTHFTLTKHSKCLYYPRCKVCRSKDWLDYKTKPGREFRLEKQRLYSKQKGRHIRELALKAYSKSNNPFCKCCGETTYEFLAIDHINGGGNKHRRDTTNKCGSYNMYCWLKRNNYPEGFQVLCHNCNLAKGFYGVCPHQKSLMKLINEN